MADVTFEQVKLLVEQMPAAELERLRAWLNIPTDVTLESDTNDLTWGKRLVAMVNDFKLDERDQMSISDPESWVHEQRRKQTSKRNKGWGE